MTPRSRAKPAFTHLDPKGEVRMVDVGGKRETARGWRRRLLGVITMRGVRAERLA